MAPFPSRKTGHEPRAADAVVGGIEIGRVARHWGKREIAVLIVVAAMALILLDVVVHRHRRRRGDG